MELSVQMHVAAGAGALLLGAGVLAREPARMRNRLFALLCLALATWNLGVAARDAGDLERGTRGDHCRPKAISDLPEDCARRGPEATPSVRCGSSPTR